MLKTDMGKDSGSFKNEKKSVKPGYVLARNIMMCRIILERLRGSLSLSLLAVQCK